MKKQIIQTIKILVLAGLLTTGISFAVPISWMKPNNTTVMPTGSCISTGANCNTQAPINTGDLYQVLSTFGVKILTVYGDTVIDGGSSSILGPSGGTSESNLHVTGRVGIGMPLSSISDALDIIGNVKITDFSHPPSVFSEIPSSICADKNGVVSLCPTGTWTSGIMNLYNGPGYPWQYMQNFTVPDGVYKIHVTVFYSVPPVSTTCPNFPPYAWDTAFEPTTTYPRCHSGFLNVMPGQVWPISYATSGATAVTTNFGQYFPIPPPTTGGLINYHVNVSW